MTSLLDDIAAAQAWQEAHIEGGAKACTPTNAIMTVLWIQAERHHRELMQRLADLSYAITRGRGE